MTAIIISAVALAVLLLTAGLLDLGRAHSALHALEQAAERLRPNEGAAPLRGGGLKLPSLLIALMRLCMPLVRPLWSEDAKRQVAKELSLAGHPRGFDTDNFLAFRVALTLIGALLGLLLEDLLLAVLLMGAGLLAPWQWLKSEAAKRQARIRADLPDFLDAIAISLSAGTPVDTALRAVTQRFDGPLQEEMEDLNAEISLNVPRQQALRRLLDRTRCRELEVLVLALIQGLQLGVPMAATLEEQARAMRHSRTQRARQLAAAASPRITLVTTLLVTPSVLVLIIGLLILNFMFNDSMHGFRDLFGGP